MSGCEVILLRLKIGATKKVVKIFLFNDLNSRHCRLPVA